jgi:hypothetical protein
VKTLEEFTWYLFLHFDKSLIGGERAKHTYVNLNEFFQFVV